MCSGHSKNIRPVSRHVISYSNSFNTIDNWNTGETWLLLYFQPSSIREGHLQMIISETAKKYFELLRTTVIIYQTDELNYLYQCEVGVCTYNLAVTKILEQNLELVQKILGGGDETLSALSQHSWHTCHPHQPHVACNEYQLGNDCDGRSDSAWMSVITDHSNDKIFCYFIRQMFCRYECYITEYFATQQW